MSNPPLPPRIRTRTALMTLTAAALAGLLIWALAVPGAGIDLTVAAAGRSIGPAAVLGTALLGGAAAWLLLALLQRRENGRARWTILALAVLVLSLGGPPLAGAAGPVLLILELMHLLVGGVLVLGLRRSAAPSDLAGRTVTAEAS